jgi:hypothetical protein
MYILSALLIVIIVIMLGKTWFSVVRFVSVESYVETDKHFEGMVIISIHTRFHVTISTVFIAVKLIS